MKALGVLTVLGLVLLLDLGGASDADVLLASMPWPFELMLLGSGLLGLGTIRSS